MQIYQLEITVEKLEAQLRREQQHLLKTNDAKRKLEMASVEHIRERDCLREGLREKRGRALHSSFLC
jgi:hypothetical protein